jgi:outer membrane protein OmpU
LEGTLKKQLMTTTALVAAGLIGTAGAANAQLKLGLGGFQEAIVGVASNNSPDGENRAHQAFDVQHDGEIHFKASQTLDNGLKIRTRVELESSTQSDQIDEAYVDISGKWGAIRIGAEDNAASLMNTGTFGAWATNVGQNTNFDVTDWVLKPKAGFTFDLTQRLELGEGDSEKITYFTPRVGGVQVGVSWIPSGEEEANGSIAGTEGGAIDVARAWALATNYRAKLGGVGVGMAAGYMAGNQPGGQAAGEGGDFGGDPKGWTMSGAFSFSGVKIAAGYQSRKSITNDSSGAVADSNELSFGAKYKFGKNHVSAGYLLGKAESTRAIAGDDEAQRLMISYRRDLAKGVQYRLNFIYADFNGEDKTTLADDNEGTAVTTSIRVAF